MGEDNAQQEKYRLIHEYTREQVNEFIEISKNIDDKAFKMASIMNFLTAIVGYIQHSLSPYLDSPYGSYLIGLLGVLILLSVLSLIIVILIQYPRGRVYVPPTEEFLKSMKDIDLQRLYSELAEINAKIFFHHEKIVNDKSNKLKLLFMVMFIYIAVLTIYVIITFVLWVI